MPLYNVWFHGTQPRAVERSPERRGLLGLAEFALRQIDANWSRRDAAAYTPYPVDTSELNRLRDVRFELVVQDPKLPDDMFAQVKVPEGTVALGEEGAVREPGHAEGLYIELPS